MRPSFFHHLHPPTIPAKQARWSYTLGAGGMAVFLSLVVGATGILEMFYYVPTPEQAALSIQTISFLVPFGGLVRSLHYWSAQMFVGVAGLHLLRVFLTGAYSGRRRFNHLLGMALFVAGILLNFTGYMLRWDQGIQWALVVGTNLIRSIPLIGNGLYALTTGGTELGPATLIRFYAWHVFGLTLPFVFVGVWHLFRVRRDGGIAVPPPALRADHERISRHELVRREVFAALISGVLLIGLALLRPAQAEAPIADMQAVAADAAAPWFFLWVQQLLRWGDAFLLGVLVPGLVALALTLLPYAVPETEPGELGRWFPRSARAVQLLTGAVTLALLLLTVMAVLETS